MRQGRSIPRTTVVLAVVLFVSAYVVACTASDKIVFRDREPFNTPPSAAAGFLGYYNVASKQTTCGNCHADIQGQWKGTGHAKAYATLNASTAKTETCFACHTVNGKGNSTVGTAGGHDTVKDSTYRDVQCESCHGPGLAHVEGVGRGSLTRPLAKLSMTGTGNCGDCHSGAHTPFVEEWRASGHAKIYASAAANVSSGCASCHDGRKALERWGVQDNYVEKGTPTNYQSVTCAVCHAPHGSANPAQLRFSVTSLDPEQNLCMQCHNRRNEPTTSQSSPHAPQGAVLLGYAGWRPPGFAYDTARIFGSHATTKNPKLCAGCHISKFTVTDKLTGAFSFNATGHLMRPLPCLDAAGKPTADKTCAYTTTARSWQSCTTAGCHANAGVAAGAFATVRARMKFFTDQLWIDSNASGSMQAAPTDVGILPSLRVTRPTEFSTTDLVITPAEGAEFNARLCGEYGQANSDNSKGIHNPFLCEALLTATVSYLRTYYALPASPSMTPTRLSGPLGGEFNSSMQVSRTPPGK